MRNEFTRKTKRAAFDRANGICECHLIPHVFRSPCGLPLQPPRINYEHVDPDAISKRNDLDNCAALRRECWRYKTDHYDKKVVAKSNRVRDRYIGAKMPRQPFRGWRRMNGEVVFNPKARS